MWDQNNPEQLDTRLGHLREYADDIRDFEAKAEAFKELRDTVICGLVNKGVPTHPKDRRSRRDIARSSSGNSE